jgi:hypothetical protein
MTLDPIDWGYFRTAVHAMLGALALNSTVGA